MPPELLRTLPHKLLRPMPLFCIQPLLARIVMYITRRHPRLFERLGVHSSKTFLINPTNLPFVLVLQPDHKSPRMLAKRTSDGIDYQACITGSFLNLLCLLDGKMDGDALFFSRELMVEGDTEAVVCLRNALDDIDGSIADEAAKSLGRIGVFGLQVLRKVES